MTQKKKDIVNSLAIHKKDVGSAEIQIGLLTDKIYKLSEHFKPKEDAEDLINEKHNKIESHLQRWISNYQEITRT